jgi:hypothetical protein
MDLQESTASKNGSKHDNTSSGIDAQMLSFSNCTTKSFGGRCYRCFGCYPCRTLLPVPGTAIRAGNDYPCW